MITLKAAHLHKGDTFRHNDSWWCCTAHAYHSSGDPRLVVVPAAEIAAFNREPQRLVFREHSTVQIGDLS